MTLVCEGCGRTTDPSYLFCPWCGGILNDIKVFVKQVDQGPPIVYHYTSAEAAAKIIEGGKLWVTEIGHLNDASEFFHGVSVAEELVTTRQLQNEEEARQLQKAGERELQKESEALINFLDKVAEELSNGDRSQVFVASFSSLADSRSQWGLYCGGLGGIGVGFDHEKLRMLTAQVYPSPTARPEQVRQAPFRINQWPPWALVNLLAHQGVRETAAVHLTWDCVDHVAGVITWDGRYDKTKQTWRQPIREETRKSFEVGLVMRERCHYKGIVVEGELREWVFFSECAQGKRRKGGKDVVVGERTASPGTYRIQSLHSALLRAEQHAGIPHIEDRALHSFRRMVAGDMYEANGEAQLAMEFINDTSAMMKHYILRRMPRVRKTAEAADAIVRLRKAAADLDAARSVA